MNNKPQQNGLSNMQTVKQWFFSTLILVLLVACSDSTFEGEYSAAAGVQKFKFQADGTVEQWLLGKKVAQYKFEKNDEEITVFMNEQTPVLFTLRDSGEIIGPGGVVMTPISIIDVATEKPSNKASETETVDKPGHNVTGGHYAFTDPNFNPEYAPTTNLFFESDEKIKISSRYYDTGEFRENEMILSYKIDSDNITVTAQNGDLLVLAIRQDGSLFDVVTKAEYIKLDE